MALRDEVRDCARELAEIRAQARNIARKTDELGPRLITLARMIPTPEQHEAEIRERIAAHTGEVHRRSAATHTDATAPGLELGSKIKRRDQRGKKLRVGDFVRVFDSRRYGTTEGTVVGPGPDTGDGKERVHVALFNGNTEYFPSTGRVRRYRKHDDADNPDAANGEHTNGERHVHIPGFGEALVIGDMPAPLADLLNHVLHDLLPQTRQ